MCGLVGYWSPEKADEQVVRRMGSALKHRGPDDSGSWLGDGNTLAFAHQRLSIIDLSPAGHQPMHSPCGRFTLIYNGEIYNHLALRAELERENGHFDWRGHSDTETLLAALRHWGVQESLHRLNGMFAFALWNANERTLTLARDRLGEKPLYYGRNNGTFFFGSELGSFESHGSWDGTIDRDSLATYMRYDNVPTPWSIIEGIQKLPPAHFVEIRNFGQNISDPRRYWDFEQIAVSGSQQDLRPHKELVSELDTLLRDAVSIRMAADVPFGAFLSGGIDSTTVAALMQAQSTIPVKTFTIGLREAGYNEAEYAKAVASHLGTDHTELYVSGEEALSAVPKIASFWDEPFADSSMLPTYLVSRLVRQYVTVSLSGDGGDELFCGYNRHTKGYDAWRKFRFLPAPLRKMAGLLLHGIANQRIDQLQRYLPARLQVQGLSNTMTKLAYASAETSGHAFYRRLVSRWPDPSALVIGGSERATAFDSPDSLPELPGLRELMMYMDTLTYLPDDILTKVDRASMAVSLEARVPLLDHRVAEFAWSVPTSLKYKDGVSKWLLREVLYQYVPRQLMERRKMGFGVPIGDWLRGPLRDWAEAMISERRLRDEGFFDPMPIRKMWDEHQSGKRQWPHHLWTVLMFEEWLEDR